MKAGRASSQTGQQVTEASRQRVRNTEQASEVTGNTKQTWEKGRQACKKKGRHTNKQADKRADTQSGGGRPDGWTDKETGGESERQPETDSIHKSTCAQPLFSSRLMRKKTAVSSHVHWNVQKKTQYCGKEAPCLRKPARIPASLGLTSSHRSGLAVVRQTRQSGMPALCGHRLCGPYTLKYPCSRSATSDTSGQIRS